MGAIQKMTGALKSRTTKDSLPHRSTQSQSQSEERTDQRSSKKNRSPPLSHKVSSGDIIRKSHTHANNFPPLPSSTFFNTGTQESHSRQSSANNMTSSRQPTHQPEGHQKRNMREDVRDASSKNIYSQTNMPVFTEGLLASDNNTTSPQYEKPNTQYPSRPNPPPQSYAQASKNGTYYSDPSKQFETFNDIPESMEGVESTAIPTRKITSISTPTTIDTSASDQPEVPDRSYNSHPPEHKSEMAVQTNHQPRPDNYYTENTYSSSYPNDRAVTSNSHIDTYHQHEGYPKRSNSTDDRSSRLSLSESVKENVSSSGPISYFKSWIGSGNNNQPANGSSKLSDQNTENYIQRIKDLEEELKKTQMSLKTQKNKNSTLENKERKYLDQLSAAANELRSMDNSFKTYASQLTTELSNTKEELSKKKIEYQVLFSEFHDSVKRIRATDDDLSTIQHQLNNIQSKISNMSMNLKKYLSPDNEKVTNFLLGYWKDELPGIKHFIKEKDGIQFFEYGIINLLVEKIVTDTLIREIYDPPIYFGLPINSIYANLSNWEPFKTTKDWSLRLREQLCFLAARPEIVESLKQERMILAIRLVDILSEIFVGFGPEVKNKLSKIIEMAAQVSLAMHSQAIPVKCKKLVEGRDKIQGGMRQQYGSGEGETTIQVVVCPPFIANEGQETVCTLMEAKVICGDFPNIPNVDSSDFGDMKENPPVSNQDDKSEVSAESI
ncbi:hypothetical protein J3Q64DRAFT_1825395 [Phycomyces blakesleeanus]